MMEVDNVSSHLPTVPSLSYPGRVDIYEDFSEVTRDPALPENSDNRISKKTTTVGADHIESGAGCDRRAVSKCGAVCRPLLSRLVSASFSIAPPRSTLEQCSQVNLTWTDEPPIKLWVAPDRQIAPGDPTLETVGIVDQSFFLWTVDIPVGQSISFTYIRLANQYLLLSSPQQYTIVAGTTSDCLAARPSSTQQVINTPQPASSMSTNKPNQIAAYTLLGVGIFLICFGTALWIYQRHARRRALSKRTVMFLLPNSIKLGKGGKTQGKRNVAIARVRNVTLYELVEVTEPANGEGSAVNDNPGQPEELNEKTSNVPLAETADAGPAQAQPGTSDSAANAPDLTATHGIIEETRHGPAGASLV